MNIFCFFRDANVTDVKKEKLQPKILGKLAVRLLKLYQIPQGMPFIIGLGIIKFCLFFHNQIAWKIIILVTDIYVTFNVALLNVFFHLITSDRYNNTDFVGR